jgi:hypothetical protein
MTRPPKRAVLEVWVGDKQDPQLRSCLESPTDSEIVEQLKLLPGGNQISAIELHISKTHYIAVGGSEKEGFHALYHEFSRAGEWETIRDDLPVDLAARLLTAYRDQAEGWKELVEWKRCAMTSVLERQREDRDAQKIASWVTKAVGFVVGFFDGRSKRSKQARRK